MEIYQSFLYVLDPCFDFTVRSYDYKGNCRAHWSCRNGLSQAKCCRVGFAYSDDKQECIPEPGCNDWCEDTGELTFTSPFGKLSIILSENSL